MSEAVIRTNHLTKCYGKLLAVDDASFTVPAGRVFGLMGRNGAGKTSLIRMLVGLTPITGGRATVLGFDSEKNHVEIRRRVGYVPETHHMYPWMTVREIARFCSAFYSMWNADLCEGMLGKFDLDPARKVKELSRGMVAKLALVLALSHEPKLLVLDEPTSGLDATVRKEFLESIVNVAADEGRTVLISSHLLTDVERVADSVALIDRGKIRLVEHTEELKSRMREVRVTFRAEPPEQFEMPGVLSVKKSAHEWLLVLDDFGPGSLPDLRARLPGATLEPRSMNLEEVFIALVENVSGPRGRNA